MLIVAAAAALAVPVPAGVGTDPAGGLLAPLHTHDASGIVLGIGAPRSFPVRDPEPFPAGL